MSESRRSASLLDTLHDYNAEHLATRADNSNLAARIASYEMAFSMQRHAPEAVDLDPGDRGDQGAVRPRRRADAQTSAGAACWPAGWSSAASGSSSSTPAGRTTTATGTPTATSMKNHNYHAGRTDKPIAGLLKDLKRRGLLDETLVIWGGEFGRQPTAEYAKGTGRDHNAYGFTMWMAGGGIKGGVSVGETDELGGAAVADRFHVKHLHATVLHQLGPRPRTG